MQLLRAALLPGREALLRVLLGLPPAGAEGQESVGGLAAPGGPAAEEAAAAGRCHLNLAELARHLASNPANYALRHASLDALHCLLRSGCPADAVPGGGDVPLLVAAAGRLDAERCRLLLEAGAAADEAGPDGRSALDVVLALCTDPELVCTRLRMHLPVAWEPSLFTRMDPVHHLDGRRDPTCRLAFLRSKSCGCIISSTATAIPPPQIQLTAEETQGAAAATERQLCALAERLHAAGAPCAAFLREQGGAAEARRALLHPTLLLAAGVTGWSPACHPQWPPAFRRAAAAVLLAARGRGVGGRRLTLPPELCHAILGRAAAPVSTWVGS